MQRRFDAVIIAALLTWLALFSLAPGLAQDASVDAARMAEDTLCAVLWHYPQAVDQMTMVGCPPPTGVLPPAARPCRVSVGADEYRYHYDDQGRMRLVERIDGPGYVIERDDEGRVATIRPAVASGLSFPAFVHHSENEVDLETSADHTRWLFDGGRVVGTSYEHLSTLVSRTTWRYDEHGRFAGTESLGADGVVLRRTELTRDGRGRPVRLVIEQPGFAPLRAQYGYDREHRVVSIRTTIPGVPPLRASYACPPPPRSRP